MSVLKRKRNLSKMEFYHNAIKLRLMITELLLKDFGIKSRRRNLEFAKEVYDIDEEDLSEIEDILSAYNIKNSFIDNFPSWLIDRALCDVVNPIVEPYLIYDNGASVKNKGIDFARKRIENHLHQYYRKYGSIGYALVIDFSKFYDNILHKPLIEMYKGIIDDERIINLIAHLVDSFSVDVSNSDIQENELFDSLKYAKNNLSNEKKRFINKSLGIGSQISQISGIYYPTRMDNYCKIVKQMKYYGRYMDDTYIISNSKEELKSLLIDIQKICDELGIFINPKKTQIFRIDKGFTFLKIKYRLTETGHVVRIPVKKGFVREKRKLRKFKKLLDNGEMNYLDIEEQYKSWRGNIAKYDCHRALLNTDKLFNELFKNNSHNSH